MSIVPRLPNKMPTREELIAPRVELTSLANAVATDVLQHTEKLMMAQNAAQFAVAVDRMAGKLAEASATWEVLAHQIWENWYR
jgi:hypothetical protein